MKADLREPGTSGGSFAGLALAGLVYVSVFGGLEAWLIMQYPEILTVPEKLYIGSMAIATVLAIASVRKPQRANQSSR